jgi:hypothetical protein
VSVASEQGQRLVGFRSPRSEQAQPDSPPQAEATEPEQGGRRWRLKLPSLRRSTTLVPSLDRATREERADERQRQREEAAVEAAREVFLATPAGRARLAYKRGHQLFQYELPVGELPPTVIPGPAGSPSRETTDPVDILNSVTVEGWKLVTGKFIHSEIRGGVVGCYLFKRSQKRRLQMNEPWRV